MAYMYAESLGLPLSAGLLGDIGIFTARMQCYFGITDDAVVNDLLVKARDWIRPKFWEHRHLLKALAHELYQREELTKAEIEEIINITLE